MKIQKFLKKILDCEVFGMSASDVCRAVFETSWDFKPNKNYKPSK
jgi:hypothetical protein